VDGDDEDGQVDLVDLLDENKHMRVQASRCGTCIYWDENRMHLEPGRREQMEADAIAADSFITCHQTLPYSEYDAPPAVCHGYWNAAKRRSWRMRLAIALDAVVRVEAPSTTWNRSAASPTRKTRRQSPEQQ
jgi:hypothetical protein